MGPIFRSARKKRKATQAQLAEQLRMSRATISGIENGTIDEIGIRKVIAVCDALGLELILREKHGRPTLQQLIAERNQTYTQTHRSERFSEKEVLDLKLLFDDLSAITERMANDDRYRKKIKKLLT